MGDNSFKNTLVISIVVAVVSALITVILTSSGMIDFFQYDVFKYNKPIMYEIKKTNTMDDFKVKEYYPLEKGNSWIYDLSYTTTIEKNTIKSYQSNIKMELIDSIEKGRLKLVVAKGDIFNIDYFELEKGTDEEFQEMIDRINNKEFVLFIDSNKVLYVDDENEINELKDFFKDDKQIIYQQKDLKTLFEFPLFDGQVIGSTDKGYYRSDDLYSRVVSRINGQFDGTYYYNESDIFTLKYWSMPDESLITFIPYVGISEAYAVHHGTVGEYKLSLKEFRNSAKQN
ncbi:hypothetical protein [Sinanaerobacter chloroacetimidivorans]|uniref:Uncharacterized protein n=1 Tax=Sinanaerobacter chloroacetimidivorans TaxID=2818044 RepID=A0A8J8B1W4_9FIRM|nr:hypothetical protein [Sinanaerobacter chloroacetimidivorans]MBR0598106.1 hypothetical protein [Sinanaerobacter chloroacetimidivorans]